jgi:hypothetical protein
MEDEDALMIAIARKRVTDEEVMEALMPGSAAHRRRAKAAVTANGNFDQGADARSRLSPRRLLPSDPGRPDRRLRREDEEIEVHVIGCDTLASGVDADWLDLAWGEGTGGAARISVILQRRSRSAGHDGRESSAPSAPISSTCSWSTATAASRPSTSTSRYMTSRICTRSSPRFAMPIRLARSSGSRRSAARARFPRQAPPV